MVQVLPGFAPQVGQNLASIVGAIQNVVDPDYELKKMIKQKVLSDPSYAQSLGNFAFSNPELYKKLGLGKIGEVIGDISPDLKTVMQEAQKGFIAEASKNPNKDLAKQAGQSALYGKTEAELRMEQQREVQAGLNIAIAKQTQGLNDQRLREGEMQLEKLELGRKGILEATANYEQLKGLDLGKIVEDAFDGKADSGVMSQLWSIPQMQGPLNELFEIERARRSLRNQLTVAQYGRSLQRRGLAEEMVLRTRTGTVDLWTKYMSDNATQERLAALVADPKIANTAQDQMLLQMFNAMNEKQNGTNARTAAQAMQRVVTLQGQSLRPNADLNAIANQMNVNYQALGEATGNYYTAEVVEETKEGPARMWGLRKGIESKRRRIVVKDIVTGEEVEPSRAVVKASGAPASNAPPQNAGVREMKAEQRAMTNQPLDAISFNKENVDRVLPALQKLPKEEQIKALDSSKKLSERDKEELRRRLGL